MTSAAGRLRLRRTLLLIGLGIGLACGPEERPGQVDARDRTGQPDGAPAAEPLPGATAAERCEAFRQRGLRIEAGTRAGFREALGEPDRAEVGTEPNRHVPDATDTLSVLHYPGLTAHFRTAGGRDFLEQVTVREARHLRFREPAPASTAADLAELLGPPDDHAGDRAFYGCSPGPGPEEPVSFRIDDDGRIRDVTFHFYVD